MIVLIDVSGFIYRAFYALPSLTRNGTEVGALYGFCSAMLKIIAIFPGAMFIAAMDAGKKTFRNDIYPEYKANRKAMPVELLNQIPHIKEACKNLGFFIAEEPGVEADDIIATYTKMSKDTHEVNIVSSDKDLFQLLGKNVSIYDPIKQRRITEEDIVKKFGVTSDKILDVLALTGDTSDNIPGIPGIGQKTASVLINKYDSLDELISNLDKLPDSKKNYVLKKEIGKAVLSKKLITLKDDLILDFTYKISTFEKFADFLLKFGFQTLAKTQTSRQFYHEISRDS
jgi:DNA polymerase-1